MQNLYFSLLFLISSASFAFECQGIIRDEKKNLVERKIILSDLISQTHFEGRFFKIVEAKNDTPIANDSTEISKRACTVYFHLTKARNYFLSNFNDIHVRNLPQLTIRVQMPYGFIDSSHFMSDQYKTYNNSLTIPPSNKNKVAPVNHWGYEIWFSPRKAVSKKNTIEQASVILQNPQLQTQLNLGVLTSVGSTMAVQLASGITLTSLEGQLYAETLLLSLFTIKLTPYLIEKTSSLFKRNIFLDTAYIPEVIYHEYVHVALAKFLRPSHHSPVIEGLANFFAADIGQTHTILHKAKKYSQGLDVLDGRKKVMFDHWMEDRRFAQYRFTFNLLYSLKKEFGDENARLLVYKTHEKLKTSSNIRHDLLSSLELSAREIYPASDHQWAIMTLNQLWQKSGL